MLVSIVQHNNNILRFYNGVGYKKAHSPLMIPLRQKIHMREDCIFMGIFIKTSFNVKYTCIE